MFFLVYRGIEMAFMVIRVNVDMGKVLVKY